MIRLSKLHGLGNDFLVSLAPELTPDPALARVVCERRTGIGADGIIHGLEPTEPDADVRMVLLNADGSEAEISGNGLRCLAQEVLRSTGRGEGTVRVQTLAGIRPVRTVRGAPAHELVTEVGFGLAGPGPGVVRAVEAVPARHRATVDVGNPHVVLVTDRPDSLDIRTVGPQLEAAYPGGINVHAAAVTSPDTVRVEVWERGVGATDACGSGAVATSWALHQLGLVGPRVEVRMPGGTVEVVVAGDGQLSLLGPSVFVGVVELAEWMVP